MHKRRETGRFGLVLVHWRLSAAFLVLFSLDHDALADNAIIFVSEDAAGANDGSSWADAFVDLQDALDAALPGGEIWVAAGAYKPVTGTDRSATFLLRNGVAVYGGFSGRESQREERNWRSHVTILSGDINNSGNESGNAYHVVTGNGTDGTTVLDGFRIEGGVATGSAPNNRGGGVYISNGSPALSNLVIAGNRASLGGGMYNSNSSPSLTNVSFLGNRAVSWGGGIANESGSEPVLTNVSFSGNQAGGSGGGMDNHNSDPDIRNSLFWGNEAWGWDGPTHSISNISSTPSISHSLLQDCKPAGNWDSDCGLEVDGSNLPDSDPLFVHMPDPGDAPSIAGDLGLQAGSPALNSGNNELVDSSADLAGNARIVDEHVDLGAYERPSDSCPGSGVLHVGQDGPEPGDGLGWASAFDDLQDALMVVGSCEIWVASGTYRPTGGIRREAAFVLHNGVGVYGGFNGTETERSQRNWQANPTVLSGDIGQSGVSDDNAFHVVTASGADGSAVLDGFSIMEGNANGEPATPCDQQCGGGVFVSDGSPILRNIQLIGNQATAWGGGLYTFSGSKPELINVLVSGNLAGWGGGIYNHLGSDPVLTNVVFSGNVASIGVGGGLRNFDNSSPVVRNTIFWNNRDSSGTGTVSASIDNSNSVPLISYSLVQGCNPGGIWNSDCGTYAVTNLFDADPLFVDVPSPDDAPSVGGNLRLRSDSPVIDAGNDAYFDGLESARDLAANPRKHGAAVELGPYEYFPPTDSVFHDRFEPEVP